MVASSFVSARIDASTPVLAPARRRARADLRDNSFDFIRLVLAAAVVVSHSFPISGLAAEPRLGDIKLGTLAVAGFFAISGFLVTGSRMRSSLSGFAVRRFLRIYPGYWVCLAFTAFVAAAIGGAVRGGWSAANAGAYVLSGLSMVGTLPLDTASLAGAPLDGSWNGSLWSLPYEVACYVAVGLVYTLGWLRRSRWLVLVAFVGATAASLLLRTSTGPGFVHNSLVVVPFFLAGALYYFYEDQLPIHPVGVGAALALLVGFMLLGHAESLAGLPVTYLVVWLSGALPRWTRNWGHRADLSYGTYLYGFPVQQLLVVAGAQRLGIAAFVACSLAATAPLAASSWFLVERPAMRLRARFVRAAPDARLT
jgi:peptidoglycan/LPS O-acetylase OafA/YrhL